MAELFPTSPLGGLVPRQIGTLTLTEAPPVPAHAVAPFRGRQAEVANVLGLSLPPPDRMATGAGLSAIWVGRGRWLVMGDLPPGLAGLAAVTDQSDAQAMLRIEGEGAEATLARLVPLDLRAAAFPEGATARTLVGHMPATVMRHAPSGFTLMTFRSMATTLVHEVAEAATHVSQRATLRS